MSKPDTFTALYKMIADLEDLIRKNPWNAGNKNDARKSEINRLREEIGLLKK